MFSKIKKLLDLVPETIILKLVTGVVAHIPSGSDVQIRLRQGEDNTQLILDAPYTAYGQTVPAGFTFDGASSPWFARWVIPKFFRVIKASCRHDYGCSMAKNFKERLVEDVVFFLMCYHVERLATWRCIAGLIGVRIGAYLGIGRSY